MWNLQTLKRIDLRLVLLLLVLMGVSLLVIASTTSETTDFELRNLFTSNVKKQLEFFLIGWAAFFFFSGIDYNKLREWTWILYVVMVVLLIGLFFTPSIQHVHRWYRIGSVAFQPSEFTKLIVVLALSWLLEKKGESVSTWKTAFQALLVMLIPFVLILKQPDLGTALVLYPITLGLFYLGGIKKSVVIAMSSFAIAGLLFISFLFVGILDHEQLRPYATKVFKEYQYERFNPDTYHQRAAKIAIALGGIKGSGWNKSEFTKRQWLPAGHTDSVFPAYAEEFGLLGVIFLLGIFYAFIYVCFQVTAVAKDRFGRLLAAGIAIYLAMHILVNLGMMCGFLPITGVPLVMVSYGGSSVLVTMSALGLLQSIYSRRFTF